MSEELQKPPVLDLDALLSPISEESPSGENLRYSGLYGEITEARRADDLLEQGAWQTEQKVADYGKVVSLATDALSTQTKDLQVAAWLSESLVYRFGFPGLRDALKLMSGLHESFWESVFPEIDEGDMEGRANAVSWLDAQCAFAIKKVPITQGNGYSFMDWEDAKRFTIPDNIDSLDETTRENLFAEQSRAEREGRVSGELWKKARAATRRQFCEETNFAIEECLAELKELNRVAEERYDRNQTPGTAQLFKAIDDVHTQVKKILADKRLEEPDPVDEAADGEASSAADGSESRSGAGGGSVSGRTDALNRLSEIAAFFQRTEPHSPVAYLVQRAVKWGNMPLDRWLQDVIKDEGVLGQIRETLGTGTFSGGYDSQGYNSEDTGSSYESETTTTDDW
ncbi:MAG TPA: type VI secretion system protein TssA [Pyrinomonadaceae bacterium]